MANETAPLPERGPAVPPSQGIFLGGAVSGVVAGIVMILVAMFYASAIGGGFWMPLRAVAASLVGVDALVMGPGVVVLGAVLHLAVSAFWGVVFAALLTRRASAGGAFWAGLAYGIGVWAVMTYGILPGVDPTLSARVALTPVPWFFYHLIFGACLLITPGQKRRFAQRALLRRAPRAPAQAAGV